ncbi:NAD-dependent DNA ligase LigA, partial [Candidatus Omnitrophota bacterium]
VLAQPVVSDKEYDDLLRELKGLEKEYPRFITPDSPTQRVSGQIIEAFSAVKHKQKMLSLDNAYSWEELDDWSQRVNKGLGSKKLEYVVELKIDGVSANLTYEKGKFILGATRGDGDRGEDVTGNLRTIRAIPLVLLGRDIPELLEIRGEVYITRQDFSSLNKQRQKLNEAVFVNPRNATAGSLKLLDPAIVVRRNLSFFAHSLGVYQGINIESHWRFLEFLKEWGLPVNPVSRICKNLEEVKEYCLQWQEKRKQLVYEVDGVVIKINNLKQQNSLGATLKNPRWAIAYKFPADQATTDVLDIINQVGRTGVITPVARLKQVECGGVTIQHATLHNFDEIERLGVKVGDRVLIERAGDVIPKVVKVVQSNGKSPFRIPRRCPACDGRVVKEKEEEVAYRCLNPSCPAQLEKGLLHFASRGAMDIEGMGESVVAQLVKHKIVPDFAEIYNLEKLQLLSLELFKDKKAENLLAAIQNSKKRPLSRLVYGLGIRHVGEKAALVLAERFKTLDNLMQAGISDFAAIYEVGTVMAESIFRFFRNKMTIQVIKKLKKAGVNMKQESLKIKQPGVMGKTFVFTGELKYFSRLEAERRVRQYGGNTSSSVSRNTSFLVRGENPGSKYSKAKQLGVKIINEEEFSRLTKGF